MSKNSFPGFVINNTTIAVDYWPKQNEPNITHFFLTHCHSDHTKNLDHSWNMGKIYCTKMTKFLLMDLNKVQEEYIEELEIDKTHVLKLDDEETFNVSLIDANHCPGAVMFLFEGYFGVILATGDFRYTPTMFIETPLQNKEVDICYIDNTYFNSMFSKFPTQNEALKEIISIIEKNREKNVLFRIILKNLGKENVLVDLANYFKTQIVVPVNRYERLTKVLKIDQKHFVTEFCKSSLIFVEDNLNLFDISEFFNSKKIIHIEPTCLPKQYSDPNYFRVSYSDHSSYSEIISFVKKLRPKRLIPIVRKMLPNEIDTTDLKALEEYLDTAPLKDYKQKYLLLLKSTSSNRKSSRLNSYRLNENKSSLANRDPTPINTRYITLRNKVSKTIKKKIEYETPEKNTPKKSITGNITPVISFSPQRRVIQITKKVNSRIRSRLSSQANSFLEPIVEENKSDLSASVLSESEHLDLKNNNTESEKNNRESSIGSEVRQSVEIKSRRKSMNNKENIDEGGSRQPKWQKLSENVEIMIKSNYSSDSLELTDTENESINSSVQDNISNKQIEKKYSIPLSSHLISKFNPVVRLEKINVNQFLKNKQSKIKIEKDEPEEEIEIKDKSDEESENSICIENTLSDEINSNSESENENQTLQNEVQNQKLKENKETTEMFLNFISEKLKDYDVTPQELGQLINKHIIESFQF